MIRILIVEDSPTAQALLIHVLTSDPEIRVVGVAGDGQEAVEVTKLLKPNVITMDIHMPKMNGIDATRQIMETQPTPIVVVSSTMVIQEVDLAYKALEAGALAVVHRPRGIDHPNHQEAARELLQTIKLMSEIRLVKRSRQAQKELQPVSAPFIQNLKPLPGIQLVAIGASTGGPLALLRIFAGLPKDFSLPILVVQHIASGFVSGFVKWLSSVSILPIHIAAQEQSALPGHIYVAPDGFHLGIESGSRMVLRAHPPENGLRPSVSHLFRSVAETLGANAAGVLLTGMGRDGAQELKLMKDKGAITIAQNEESSIVYGMPGEAVKLDAATYILAPSEIAEMLARISQERQGRTL